jgi:hypothetical protein
VFSAKIFYRRLPLIPFSSIYHFDPYFLLFPDPVYPVHPVGIFPALSNSRTIKQTCEKFAQDGQDRRDFCLVFGLQSLKFERKNQGKTSGRSIKKEIPDSVPRNPEFLRPLLLNFF